MAHISKAQATVDRALMAQAHEEREIWDRGWTAALEAAIEDALPSTAENPNEDAYQRGRFDGIMEYQKALRDLLKD